MASRTLSELARITGAVLEGDGSRSVVGPASLREAGVEHVSFYDPQNPRYLPELETTRAGAVVVPLDLELRGDRFARLRSESPSRAFTAIVGVFREDDPRPEPGVHPSAVVDPAASIDPSAAIGSLCSIGAGARIEAQAVLHPGVHVGEGARVGERSVLHSGVVLYAAVSVGADCVLHSGAIVGADGFGFEPTPEGWAKIPQCGTVEIGDDVEIGANTTIDRARFGATRIERGAKLDNLIHIAHNVSIGEGALLIAQAGVSGSSIIGRRAILAGQVGIIGHLEIGEGARVAAQSGVTKDVPPGGDVVGSPARKARLYWRQMAQAARLPDQVDQLRKRLAKLEQELARKRGEEVEAP